MSNLYLIHNAGGGGVTRFKVTSGTYSESVSNDAACKSEFGTSYSLADWTDLVAYSAGDPTILSGWRGAIGGAGA